MMQALIGPITNLVGGWLNNKAEEKQAKHQAKLQVIQNNADWESKMADASAHSWKDEFWTIILSIPIFMVGYAIAINDIGVIDRVDAGFKRCHNCLSGISICCSLRSVVHSVSAVYPS